MGSLTGHIRKLNDDTQAMVSAHLLRLSSGDRRMRFGGYLSDESVAAYAARSAHERQVRLGFFSRGQLRGLGELVIVEDEHGALFGEVGLSVETDYQDQGVGTELMSRLITLASNRNVPQLRMLCLRENRRVQRLASKFEAELVVYPSEVEGRLTAPWPTYLSVLEEMTQDNTALCWLMFETFTFDALSTRSMPG